MKYLAAYCMLALDGNKNITEGDISSVLQSVGMESNADRVVDALKGELHSLISRGLWQLGNLSFGGVAAGGSSGPVPEKKAEAPAQQAKVEEEEDMDIDAGTLRGRLLNFLNSSYISIFPILFAFGSIYPSYILLLRLKLDIFDVSSG